jgi:hypothetical protein
MAGIDRPVQGDRRPASARDSTASRTDTIADEREQRDDDDIEDDRLS